MDFLYRRYCELYPGKEDEIAEAIRQANENGEDPEVTILDIL